MRVEKPDILYFLLDDNGQCYWNDSDGNLISLPSPRQLPQSPDGWADLSLQWERNENYDGIVRKYTLPLGFVLFGRRLLQQIFHQTLGIESRAIISLAKYNPATMRYRPFFSSALNFSTFIDGKNIAEISATEGDLVALIKANEGTTYEIPVDVPEALSVQFDGIILYSVVNTLHYAALVDDGAGGQVPNPILSRYNFIGIAITNTETTYPSVLWATTTTYRGAESLDVDPADWLFQVEDDNISVRVQCDAFHAILAGSTGYRVGLYIRDGAGNARQVDIVPFTPVPGTVVDIEFSFDVTIPMNKNERGWLFFENRGGGAGKTVSFPTDNRINFTYNYRKATTEVQCLRPLYVFQQLISKITDGKYSATSSVLGAGGEAYDTVLTCGDSLRGFRANIPVDYEGPRLRTSLRDFFQSYGARYSIGITTYDNIARIESRKSFYGDDVVLDVGVIDDEEFKFSPATDRVFNTIKVGYPNQTYDDVNGRSEFNTTQTYTSPVKTITSELDLSSKYRADSYGVEFTRINLENRTTTDAGSDNDVFMIRISPSGAGFILSRPAYSNITGVPGGATVFNTELSPKRCLQAHGPFLHSCLDKLDAQPLVFQTTDKNRQLVTVLNGVETVEQANVLIGDLGTKMFLPYIFEFKCKVPVDAELLMNTNPYGKIQFTHLGYQFRGYVISVAQSAAVNTSQVFRLLASPDNDLSKLIQPLNG